jgi:drug/metabolite transporter (DMT)-like permease
MPLIGSLLAAVFLGEPLSPVTIFAIALVTGGVVLIARRMGTVGEHLVNPWFALAAAFSWGVSPLFIRWGLEGLPSPIIGVTIGLFAAAGLYALILAGGAAPTTSGLPFAALGWILIGGVLVAAAIGAQWTALDLTEVSTVVTLQLTASPVVVLIAPFVVGTEIEQWNWRLVAGMVAVLAGSVLTIWTS